MIKIKNKKLYEVINIETGKSDYVEARSQEEAIWYVARHTLAATENLIAEIQ